MKKFLTCKLRTPVLAATILGISAFSFNQVALAEVTVQSGYEHYVTDDIEIPFRSQPGYKYRILRMVRTGAKVEVLEVNEEKWARVNYLDSKGKQWEGWMPSVLLQNEPAAKVLLEKETERFAQLEKRFNQQKLEKDALQTRFDKSEKELETIQKSYFQLNKQYEQLNEISTNAVNINNENQTLKANIKKLNAENMIIKEQLNEAEDVLQRQWFLTGAGVLFLGLILGRFARLPEKKSRWNSM